MSQKVLQISAEDAKYLDPNQMASITLVDGTTIIINGNTEEGFVEEGQAYIDANPNEQVQVQDQQQQPALRGVGSKIAAGLLATGAVVAGAAALGSALKPRGPRIGAPMRGPAMMGPGMGVGMRGPAMMGPGMGMMGPGMGMMKPGMASMGRPGMGMGMQMGRPGMVRPMGGFRARRQDNTNEEETCPYCNK